MKILITTDLYNVTTNGVVTSIKVLCRELEKQGHDVRILTLSDTRHSYQEGNVTYIASVSIGAIYPDLRMALNYRCPLLREIIAWKPDVIHSQCEFFSYQFAKRLARRLGVPLIHTYHSLYEQYVPYVTHCKFGAKALVGSFSRHRLKKADYIIAPTQKVATALRGYKVRSPIVVIPSGIFMERHNQRLSDAERTALRSQLNIPSDHRILLNLGRLGFEKNLQELLHYTGELLTTDNKLTLLFVGDGPARHSLEALAQELGVAENVRFTGRVEPTQVHRYYQLADLFVNASTSETQGLTYIEAAANGLPLLCRRDPCLEEVLQEGRNGFTYTQKAEFLTALHYILDHPQWCACASQQSRETAQRFSGEHFAAAVENLYLIVSPSKEALCTC